MMMCPYTLTSGSLKGCTGDLRTDVLYFILPTSLSPMGGMGGTWIRQWSGDHVYLPRPSYVQDQDPQRLL